MIYSGLLRTTWSDIKTDLIQTSPMESAMIYSALLTTCLIRSGLILLKVYLQYSVMCVDKAIVTEVSNQSKCIREHGLKQGEGTRQNKTEGGKWNDRGQEGKWYRSRKIAPIYSRWKHTHSGDREWTITLKTGGSDISNLLGPTDATTRWYSKLVQQDVTQQGGTTSSTRGHTTW